MQTISVQGISIPALGFGTWRLAGKEATHLVRSALEIGYRHIDTAQMYGNEAEVGRGIAESGIARDDIWLTTKIWPDNFADGVFQKAAAERLALLKQPYVDLLLLHWPNAEIPLAQTIRALNEVLASGLARHVGISNFTTRLIDEAAALSDAPLVMNQVEYHPYLDQSAVLGTLARHDMALTAYCPIAQGKIFADPVLAEIGEKHGKNAGQIALRWLLQQDRVAAIPRTASEDHARSNFDIFDFRLSDPDMRRIHALARPDGRLVKPDFGPDWDPAPDR
ncbi:aldo/keto reductase [Oceanibacterium hippocampi]|uniref:2,5-diketo-D-gluconic acid reductase B n=1 Tax=Oceanibacterium hippocampi TaxID=745714 RepID=A0A1Y5TI90_9PROT|nr:aldo/keto reductase [Oceanibacterium hippocampi]SLN64909.1 2,5-diketo-D-gluconic acid reductase B [Oceanibacterium hippocampi]